MKYAIVALGMWDCQDEAWKQWKEVIVSVEVPDNFSAWDAHKQDALMAELWAHCADGCFVYRPRSPDFRWFGEDAYGKVLSVSPAPMLAFQFRAESGKVERL